jgi:hypothetical protein
MNEEVLPGNARPGNRRAPSSSIRGDAALRPMNWMTIYHDSGKKYTFAVRRSK